MKEFWKNNDGFRMLIYSFLIFFFLATIAVVFQRLIIGIPKTSIIYGPGAKLIDAATSLIK